ncbi:transposable element Tcb1 transposase [Trichonephila clavipes]|nr:transposable element Tcb1 transposase [Trichonephila clavipes]
MHRHTGPAQGIIVWCGIEYLSRTPLVRITGTLKGQRYISEVLEPVVLPYLQIEYPYWPVRSPDLSPIEDMWSMVAHCLTQITPPAATPDNFGNVWKLLGLLYPKNTIKVSLNHADACDSGDLQQLWLIWLLILARSTLHRSLQI